MKPVRKVGEQKCQKCGALSNLKIEFEHNTVVLCQPCADKFKEQIKDKYL